MKQGVLTSINAAFGDYELVLNWKHLYCYTVSL